MYLWLIMILLFFGCVAFLVNGGLWTNTLVLINTVTAGLIAFNYFEPLAGWLDKQLPSFTYVWDFLCVWLVFSVAMGIMRTATDLLSQVKVKFKRPVDQIGGILMACIVGMAHGLLHDGLAAHRTAWRFAIPLLGNFPPHPIRRWGVGDPRPEMAELRRHGVETLVLPSALR